MSTQQSLTQFRAVLEKHKENQIIYKEKLREINSTRNRISDHLDGLQQTYEKKIKANQQKLEALRTQNEGLVRQNILYKTEIESYQSRLLQKQKIIAMLLNQKKDIGGVGSSDRSKSQKTDSINANEQDYKSFKKQITPTFKQELQSSHSNDKIKDDILSQDKPIIDNTQHRQEKIIQNQQVMAHIVKNLPTQPISIKRKSPPPKQVKNEDIPQQISIKEPQLPSEVISSLIDQKEQERQIKMIPPPPPSKTKRLAPPPPPPHHKKGDHKQIVSTIPEVIKQIPSLNNSNTYGQQRVDENTVKNSQIQPIQKREPFQQQDYVSQQVQCEKQQQEQTHQIDQPFNPYENYQPELQEEIVHQTEIATYQASPDKYPADTNEIQVESLSNHQPYKIQADQPDPNNFWSHFGNNDQEDHQEALHISHETKNPKTAAKKKKTTARANIAQINFQSEQSMNSTDFFSQLAKAEPESSNHLQIEESSIDHIDRDNSLISNEHAYFAEEPIITTKPRAVKMVKKKGKRDQIKIVDPSMFE